MSIILGLDNWWRDLADGPVETALPSATVRRWDDTSDVNIAISGGTINIETRQVWGYYLDAISTGLDLSEDVAHPASQRIEHRLGGSNAMRLGGYNVNHAYEEPGSYACSVKMTNADGGVRTYEWTVNVVASTKTVRYVAQGGAGDGSEGSPAGTFDTSTGNVINRLTTDYVLPNTTGFSVAAGTHFDLNGFTLKMPAAYSTDFGGMSCGRDVVMYDGEVGEEDYTDARLNGRRMEFMGQQTNRRGLGLLNVTINASLGRILQPTSTETPGNVTGGTLTLNCTLLSQCFSVAFWGGQNSLNPQPTTEQAKRFTYHYGLTAPNASMEEVCMRLNGYYHGAHNCTIGMKAIKDAGDTRWTNAADLTSPPAGVSGMISSARSLASIEYAGYAEVYIRIGGSSVRHSIHSKGVDENGDPGFYVLQNPSLATGPAELGIAAWKSCVRFSWGGMRWYHAVNCSHVAAIFNGNSQEAVTGCGWAPRGFGTATNDVFECMVLTNCGVSSGMSGRTPFPKTGEPFGGYGTNGEPGAINCIARSYTVVSEIDSGGISPEESYAFAAFNDTGMENHVAAHFTHIQKDPVSGRCVPYSVVGGLSFMHYTNPDDQTGSVSVKYAKTLRLINPLCSYAAQSSVGSLTAARDWGFLVGYSSDDFAEDPRLEVSGARWSPYVLGTEPADQVYAYNVTPLGIDAVNALPNHADNGVFTTAPVLNPDGSFSQQFDIDNPDNLVPRTAYAPYDLKGRVFPAQTFPGSSAKVPFEVSVPIAGAALAWIAIHGQDPRRGDRAFIL